MLLVSYRVYLSLYQEQQGQKRVIAYASRGLSQCEARYPAHKLKFLALKWVVTDKFHDYLYGNSFPAVTDSNPLIDILTSVKLDATSYRWLAALSIFNVQLQCSAGKQNQNADGLSRPAFDWWLHTTKRDGKDKAVDTKTHVSARTLHPNDWEHSQSHFWETLCPSAEKPPVSTLAVSLAHHPKEPTWWYWSHWHGAHNWPC